MNKVLPIIAMLWVVAAAAGDAENRALLKAANTGDLKAMQDLIKGGADVNFRANFNVRSEFLPGMENEPLLGAIAHGGIDAVKLLLANGARPDGAMNSPVDDGMPLWTALRRGHTEAADLLIAKGADMKKAFSKALGIAFATATSPQGVFTHAEVLDPIKGLLDRGADPNHRDAYGSPVIEYQMCFLNHDAHGKSQVVDRELFNEVFKLLIDYGADPRDAEGKPLREVVPCNHLDSNLRSMLKAAEKNPKPRVASPKAAGAGDTEKRLEQLKSMFDKGLITKDEYDKKRKEILDSL